MRFDADTRTQLLVDVVTDFDPTGSTCQLQVDTTWYTAVWQGSPSGGGTQWKQTARTNQYFAGPNATAAGATVLTTGRHPTQTRVTLGEQVITRNSDPLDVVA